MMNEDKFNLGDFLKSVRNEYKFSTRQLAKVTGFSHSYISSVENNVKKSPSTAFIQKYFMGLTNKNTADANYYIEKVNRLSKGEYTFEKVPTKEYVNSMISAFAQVFSDTHTFVEEGNKENPGTERTFTEPINDINFHLNDTNNNKYFRKIKIDHDEMIYINEMINNYLLQVYYAQLKEVTALFISGEISKETHKKEEDRINEIINTLDDKENLYSDEIKFYNN